MMIRGFTVLVLLCSCNEILGLRATEHTKRDAAIDAPFHCPAAGTTAPEFSTFLHQFVVQDVKQYVPMRAERAVAICSDGLEDVACEGPLAGPFVPSTGVEI